MAAPGMAVPALLLLGGGAGGTRGGGGGAIGGRCESVIFQLPVRSVKGLYELYLYSLPKL